MGYAPRNATPPTRQAVVVDRVIRISGSPLGLHIYGYFGSAVEFALVDHWLSQAEISFLNAGAMFPVPAGPGRDSAFLFRALTGYFPPKDKKSFSTPDHSRTYDSIVKLANDMTYRRNTYIKWRYLAIPWTTMVKTNIAIPSLARQITAEPDISGDDKKNLRGGLYLAALRQLGRTSGAPTATVTIVRRDGSVAVVGPLSPTDAARYDSLRPGPGVQNMRSGSQDLNVLLDLSDVAVFNLAQTVLNGFGVTNY
jgi:hypothetical protein